MTNATSHQRVASCPVCHSSTCEPFLYVGAKQYWRCQHCQATYLDPAQLPDEAVEMAEYRLHCNEVDSDGYRQFLSRLCKPLLDRLSPNSAGLDYGCGPGPALAAMLSEAGHRMTVYDPLFFNDELALKAQYDFITCTEVAEHFHYPFEEFERLDKRLNPGGVLAVMTRFQTDDAAFANWHYRRDPTHVVFYREQTFQVIAQKHHWRCETACPNVVFLHKPFD
ncbi:MAG: class I SAM-dependent methyltransferase [Orrella sp.]